MAIALSPLALPASYSGATAAFNSLLSGSTGPSPSHEDVLEGRVVPPELLSRFVASPTPVATAQSPSSPSMITHSRGTSWQLSRVGDQDKGSAPSQSFESPEVGPSRPSRRPVQETPRSFWGYVVTRCLPPHDQLSGTDRHRVLDLSLDVALTGFYVLEDAMELFRGACSLVKGLREEEGRRPDRIADIITGMIAAPLNFGVGLPILVMGIACSGVFGLPAFFGRAAVRKILALVRSRSSPGNGGH